MSGVLLEPVTLSPDFCNQCGGRLATIRGRYPGDKDRKICPTCAQERLEQINQISSEDYNKTAKS